MKGVIFMRKTINFDIMNKIGDLHRAGYSHKKIADKLKISEDQVKSIRKYQIDYMEGEL